MILLIKNINKLLKKRRDLFPKLKMSVFVWKLTLKIIKQFEILTTLILNLHSPEKIFSCTTRKIKNAEENALKHICIYLVIKISVWFHLIAFLHSQHRYTHFNPFVSRIYFKTKIWNHNYSGVNVFVPSPFRPRPVTIPSPSRP